MPRAIRFVSSLCLPLAAALACARPGTTEQTAIDPPRGIWAGYVGTSSSDAGISAVNQTERPVYYAAFERGMLATTLWVPCTGEPTCRTLAPGGTTTLPWNEVEGYDPSKKEYLFYWWHGVQDDKGGMRPDSVRAVVITR
jgi:hypothetical protein